MGTETRGSRLGNKGRKVGEAEGYGEEGLSGGQEAPGGPRGRGRELRGQAELAWARVQQVIQQGGARGANLERLLERLEQVPTATFMAGIAASFLASAGLLAAGRRNASTILGIGGPFLLGLALYLKTARQARRL